MTTWRGLVYVPFLDRGQRRTVLARRVSSDLRTYLALDALECIHDRQPAALIASSFKTEVIRRRGPWRPTDDVEFAVLEWVD